MVRRIDVRGVEGADAIINHPDVRPFVAFDDTPHMTLAGVVADERNIVLMSANGGFAFIPNASSSAYHLHTFFLPEGRGREVHDAAWEAFEWMFTRTPARWIYTLVPDDSPHARPPLSFGWRGYFSRPDLFTRNGVRIGAQFWRLDVWDWAIKQKRISGLHGVLQAIAERQKTKARGMAAEWFDWSGEELKCP